MLACKKDTRELSIRKTERCNEDSMRLVPYYPKTLFPKKSRSNGFVIRLRLFSFNLRQFILRFDIDLGFDLAPIKPKRKIIVFIGDIKKRKFLECYFNLVEIEKFV
jgi:hypothetical protein